MPLVLPSSHCILLDAIEYFAHSTFLENSTKDDILFAAEQMERLCRAAFATNDLARENSRVWNRILMVMLIQNVCTRNTSIVLNQSDDDHHHHHHEEQNYDPNAMIHMEPTGWEELLENLETCRTSLVKAIAGSSLSYSAYPSVDEEDKMAPWHLFQERYQEVHDLITCHVAISRFRYSLQQQLSIAEEQEDNFSYMNSKNEVLIKMTNVKSQQDFSTILDDFVDHLPKAFSQTDLVSRLRKDVLKFSPRRASPTASTSSAMTIRTTSNTNITMVKKILSDVTEMLQSPDKPYSYVLVQDKCKSLCRAWSDSILGTPILVQLGYSGDKTNTTVGLNKMMMMTTNTMMGETDATGDDAKTVSSWGMDDDEVQERQEIALAELKSIQMKNDKNDDDDVSDYQTADDEDQNENSNFSNTNNNKTHPTKSHEHVNEMHALEIRPRENWREEFRLIDKLRTDDEGFGEDDAQQNGKDSTQKGQKRTRRRPRRQPSVAHKSLDESSCDSDNQNDSMIKTKTKLSGAELMKRRKNTKEHRRRLLQGSSPWKPAVSNPILVAAARQRKARRRQKQQGLPVCSSRSSQVGAAVNRDKFDIDGSDGSVADAEADNTEKRSKSVASSPSASGPKQPTLSPTSTTSSSPFKKRKTITTSTTTFSSRRLRSSSSHTYSQDSDDESSDDNENLPPLLRQCLNAPPPKLPTYAEEILKRRGGADEQQVTHGQQRKLPPRGIARSKPTP